MYVKAIPNIVPSVVRVDKMMFGIGRYNGINEVF